MVFFQDRERIIGLLNSFRLIVEHAVADKNSQTARRNERAMVGGQCVDRSGEANAVARTTPAVPFRTPPNEALASISVKDMISVFPLFQLKREKRPNSSESDRSKLATAPYLGSDLDESG